MRIGIDGTTLCDPSGGRGAGIEHYTWSIIFTMIRCAPEHSFFISIPSYFSKKLEKELVQGQSNIHFMRPFFPRVPFLSRHLGIPLRMKAKRVDVLFGPAGQLPLGWLGRSVVTIHDVSIFDHPEWFPEERVKNFSTEIIVPQSIKHASKIIAVSEFTKQQVERLFPFAKGNVVVIHEGVYVPQKISTLAVDQMSQLGKEDMILYVGTIEPRKNIENAIVAFHRFLEMHPDRVYKTRFILAGKMGWKTEQIVRVMKEVNEKWQDTISDDVVRAIGYVSEKQKWALLTNATALMLVSFEEGFGLPLLEALCVGTPVIASRRGSLPEIGGDVVLFVEPDDVENMSLAIAQCVLVPDGVSQLQHDGKEHAKIFTWERAARQTLAVLENTIKKWPPDQDPMA